MNKKKLIFVNEKIQRQDTIKNIKLRQKKRHYEISK